MRARCKTYSVRNQEARLTDGTVTDNDALDGLHGGLEEGLLRGVLKGPRFAIY